MLTEITNCDNKEVNDYMRQMKMNGSSVDAAGWRSIAYNLILRYIRNVAQEEKKTLNTAGI